MRRDFTDEELYERYARDVMDYLVSAYGLTRAVAMEKMADAGLRNYFLRDPEMFEFMEASKVAKLVIVAERLVDRE